MSSILTAGGLDQSVGHLTAEREVTRLRACSPIMVSERENTRASRCSCMTSRDFPKWRACLLTRWSPDHFALQMATPFRDWDVHVK